MTLSTTATEKRPIGQMEGMERSLSHPLTLSALLLVLSASRFLAPGFPLFVPARFLSLAPLYGMTFPFLSERDPLWTPSAPLQNTSFKQNNGPAIFVCILKFLRKRKPHRCLRLCVVTVPSFLLGMTLIFFRSCMGYVQFYCSVLHVFV